MNTVSPLLQTLTSVAAQVAEMERQIDELTQAVVEQRARIENYEALLQEPPTPNEQRGALGLPPLSDRPVVTPGLWLLPHRGDPCLYCGRAEVKL